jgi:hypothetical protein
MGAMYEGHLAQDKFRDLFDAGSSQWADTAVAQKVLDLRAFETAGVPPAELVAHYRETRAQNPGHDAARTADGLAAALRAYAAAGYAPDVPPAP